MTQPSEMRAGNTDRERVIEALQRAYADGRLGDDELAERIEATHTARTFGDLDAVVADLPITPPSAGVGGLATTSPAAAPPAPSAPPAQRGAWGEPVPRSPIGGGPDNPLVLDGGWWSDKRDGPWEIPQYLLLKGGMGSVSLDCTEATTPHSVIHLWIEGDMGSITVVVPEGWAADANGLRKSMGSVNVRVPLEPTMGRPMLVLNGAMGLGSITVRNPNWFERKRLEKRLR